MIEKEFMYYLLSETLPLTMREKHNYNCSEKYLDLRRMKEVGNGEYYAMRYFMIYTGNPVLIQ
jgi:hypothetical protein